ncbi:MAG: branched-chain amino acid aminotransferase [Cyclobacteriaceae bacterium]|nr:branched-chain amino acid aminotransferase [Cyclobacteriaceae bacterium]
METTTAPVRVQRVAQSRLKEVDFSNLEFGKYISDHMAMVDFADGHWHEPLVVPYSNLSFSPAMLSLHYGQAIFEGMKAFRRKDGSIIVFRPKKHIARLNKSLDRMCMPEISEELFMTSLQSVLDVDRDWVPSGEGASLYIRPVVFATEARLGVKISDTFKFIILLCPVGPYQAKPYKLKVEDKFVRTAEGGTGFAKCAGNYGGAFYPSKIAREEGFDQILWTDAKEHKYIDEVGMMNVLFVLNNKLVTPQLNTAILDGVTRDSILTLARDMGYPVEERRVTVAEVEEGFRNGSLQEVFGAGTAAVVAPIALINIHGTNYEVPAVKPDSFQLKVKQQLHDMRMGTAPDKHQWNWTLPA